VPVAGDRVAERGVEQIAAMARAGGGEFHPIHFTPKNAVVNLYI
jgi:hypothetical protein